MSIRRKVLVSVIAVASFIIWKIIDFYEYVAVFFSPQELAARNAPWKSMLKQVLFRGWVAYVAIALLVLVLLAIWLSEPIVRSFRRKTPLEKFLRKITIDDVVEAQYGTGRTDLPDNWRDLTENNTPLIDLVKELVRSPDAASVTFADLEMPSRFCWGRDKELRLTFSDGTVLSIPKDMPLRLESGIVIKKGRLPKGSIKPRPVPVRKLDPEGEGHAGDDGDRVEVRELSKTSRIGTVCTQMRKGDTAASSGKPRNGARSRTSGRPAAVG